MKKAIAVLVAIVFTLGAAVQINRLYVGPLRTNKQSLYYINPVDGNDSNPGTLSSPFKTLSVLSTLALKPGDIVDGYGAIYFERLTVPASDLTIRNLILDGTKSLTNAWAQRVGEVYTNTLNLVTPFFWEDGIRLNPILSTSDAEATNLARGQWSFYSKKLYYRASDGADPATHNLRICSREYDGEIGLLSVTNKSNVSLQNITVRRFGSFNASPYTVYVRLCNGLTLDHVTSAESRIAGFVDTVSNFVATNLNVYSNCGGGLTFSSFYGASSNVNVSGAFNYNGTEMLYSGTAYAWNGDGDGLSFGQGGGIWNNVSLIGVNSVSNGPPFATNYTGGSGIYFGTSYPMALTNLLVSGCYVKGNHNYGLLISTTVDGTHTNTASGVTVTNSIFQQNGNNNDTYRASVSYAYTNSASFLFVKNLVCDNDQLTNFYYAAGLGNPVTTGTYIVTNNVFYNNGNGSAGGAYQADLGFTQATPAGSPVDYNVFARNSGYAARAAIINTTVYSMAGIYSTFPAGSGGWTHNSTNSVFSNPTTLTYISP